jgi:hypothetical protein
MESISLRKIERNYVSFSVINSLFQSRYFPNSRVCSTVLLIICMLDSLFKRKIYSAEKIRLEYSSLFRIYFHHWKHVDYFVKCEIWQPKCLLSTHVLHFLIRISSPPPNPLFLNCFLPMLRTLVIEMECLSWGRDFLRAIIKLILDVIVKSELNKIRVGACCII